MSLNKAHALSIRVTNLLALKVLSLGKRLHPVQNRTLVTLPLISLLNKQKESRGKLENVFMIVQTVLFKFNKICPVVLILHRCFPSGAMIYK